jgi:hypothetical protein
MNQLEKVKNKEIEDLKSRLNQLAKERLTKDSFETELS